MNEVVRVSGTEKQAIGRGSSIVYQRLRERSGGGSMRKSIDEDQEMVGCCDGDGGRRGWKCCLMQVTGSHIWT